MKPFNYSEYNKMMWEHDVYESVPAMNIDYLVNIKSAYLSEKMESLRVIQQVD